MRTTKQKGDYYRRKTVNWLKDLGFQVETLEKLQRVYTGGKILFLKKDIWGSDLIAMNQDKLVFVQVKLNKKNISSAKIEFNKYIWPKCNKIEKWIVVWTPKQKQPEVIKL